MEVVLLLVALLGIALIAVPRIQRRRSGARRPARRRAPARQAKAVAATPPVATWTPPARSGEWEVWDDELGWEGVDAAPAPEPEPVAEREPDRAQWERWRAEELAPEAEEPAHEPTQAVGGELPSVERWRERHAAGDDWDDDGLGWEGAAAPPVRDFGRDEPPPVSPARDEVAPLRPRDWDHDDVATPPARAWADDVPARPWADNVPAPPARDWSRTGHDPAHANGNGVAPATALNGNGAAPISVARVPEPVEEWPADDAWEAKPATQAANDGNGHATVTLPAKRRGRRRLNPVVLVAIYAAAGILVVVLASTFLLGHSSSGTPKPKATPAATAKPKATATPGSATSDTVPAVATPDPAAAAKARKAAAARRSYLRGRRSAGRSERRAVTRARAAHRRKVRRDAIRRSAPIATPQVVSPPPAPTPAPATPVVPRHYAPAPAPRPSGCEFCIG